MLCDDGRSLLLCPSVLVLTMLPHLQQPTLAYVDITRSGAWQPIRRLGYLLRLLSRLHSLDLHTTTEDATSQNITNCYICRRHAQEGTEMIIHRAAEQARRLSQMMEVSLHYSQRMYGMQAYVTSANNYLYLLTKQSLGQATQ